MGNTQSARKVNYEDVQYVIKNAETHILINTLNENEQMCLIQNTVCIQKEVEIINKLIQNGKKQIKIIIYGRNCNDEKIYAKYNQLVSLGFYEVYIYTGGLFEWLMLQDIYGDKEFLTTKKEIDFLKYKPHKLLNINLIHF
jgi:23S rRNA pseudoU1915 N3-methylase RlmH